MTLTIEYLIIIKQDDDFCKDESSYINFLGVDTTIKTGKKLNIKTIIDTSSNLEVQYDIVCEEIPLKSERVFNLKMLSREDKLIKEFNQLARKIKKISLKINPGKTQIHTIQDDIGTHYAVKAYPLIHNVENALRKLISKFLIIKVGTDWFKESVHDEIVKGLNKNKSDVFNDYLYNLDFIDLSDVLFKPYRNTTLLELDAVISKANSIDDINFERIKSYMPKSNWERHFSTIVHIDANVFQEKWTKLYSIRNEVAHNRYLTEGKYSELLSLIESIQPIIEKAYESVDRIKLSAIDIEMISIVLNQSSFHSYSSPHTPRLMAAAKEFNVGKDSLIDFLISKGFNPDDLKPTAKLTEQMYYALQAEFRKRK